MGEGIKLNNMLSFRPRKENTSFSKFNFCIPCEGGVGVNYIQTGDTANHTGRQVIEGCDFINFVEKKYTRR